jgi:murein L,D-transpeptidase YcbB/YkuD
MFGMSLGSWPLRLAALALLVCLRPATAAEALPWFDGGRPGVQARQAVELLADAPSHGLEPQDYDAAALAQAVARAADGPASEPAAIAHLERALGDAMQRFLADLHNGRVDLRQIGYGYSVARREPFDAAAVLTAALAAQRLPDAVREAAPQLPMYERLREALARYRELAAHPAWKQPLPAPRGGRAQPAKLEPGQDYSGLALLAQRLQALGDLAPQAGVPLRYEGSLVDAVKSFQQRHGLVADGVIGKSTLAQLEVSPAARVRQIELALERLRWTPLTQGPRMIVVNIPEFVLRAYEIVDGRIDMHMAMKVIVGKAMDTPTPVFDEDMRHIEFSPYWNVPLSIARGEIVPQLRHDPGQFDRMGFEFVAPDGRVSTAYSADALDAVDAGGLRIRQRPGARNALGDIKFVLPNRDNIYLHHTPSTGLFTRERRDFSHGCIRVERPVELAKFVLQGMPQWTEERIRQTMARGQSSTLRLAEPVPVLIAYATTLVLDERVHFFHDLYGQDRLLDNTLRKRTPVRRTIAP